MIIQMENEKKKTNHEMFEELKTKVYVNKCIINFAYTSFVSN